MKAQRVTSMRSMNKSQVCLTVLKQLLLNGWTSHQTLGPLLTTALQNMPGSASDWRDMLSNLCQESNSDERTFSALQAALQSLIVWQEEQPESPAASIVISETLALLRKQVSCSYN